MNSLRPLYISILLIRSELNIIDNLINNYFTIALQRANILNRFLFSKFFDLLQIETKEKNKIDPIFLSTFPNIAEIFKRVKQINDKSEIDINLITDEEKDFLIVKFKPLSLFISSSFYLFNLFINCKEYGFLDLSIPAHFMINFLLTLYSSIEYDLFDKSYFYFLDLNTEYYSKYFETVTSKEKKLKPGELIDLAITFCEINDPEKTHLIFDYSESEFAFNQTFPKLVEFSKNLFFPFLLFDVKKIEKDSYEGSQSMLELYEFSKKRFLENKKEEPNKIDNVYFDFDIPITIINVLINHYNNIFETQIKEKNLILKESEYLDFNQNKISQNWLKASIINYKNFRSKCILNLENIIIEKCDLAEILNKINLYEKLFYNRFFTNYEGESDEEFLERLTSIDEKLKIRNELIEKYKKIIIAYYPNIQINMIRFILLNQNYRLFFDCYDQNFKNFLEFFDIDYKFNVIVKNVSYGSFDKFKDQNYNFNNKIKNILLCLDDGEEKNHFGFSELEDENLEINFKNGSIMLEKFSNDRVFKNYHHFKTLMRKREKPDSSNYCFQKNKLSTRETIYNIFEKDKVVNKNSNNLSNYSIKEEDENSETGSSSDPEFFVSDEEESKKDPFDEIDSIVRSSKEFIDKSKKSKDNNLKITRKREPKMRDNFSNQSKLKIKFFEKYFSENYNIMGEVIYPLDDNFDIINAPSNTIIMSTSGNFNEEEKKFQKERKEYLEKQKEKNEKEELEKQKEKDEENEKDEEKNEELEKELDEILKCTKKKKRRLNNKLKINIENSAINKVHFENQKEEEKRNN